MDTILGAGGPIGNELAKILTARNAPVRLVSRNPKPLPGAEVHVADLSNREETLRAVAGSSVVFLLAGLKYDIGVWRQLWPLIIENVVEACKRAQAKLIFFDNVYMYGKVDGPMTEQTPYNPCSKKGEVRARIATMLMAEAKAGNLKAMIARSADFYGPKTRNGVPNMLVFEALAKGATPSWLANADVPHSLTFTPDAALGLDVLARSDSAWNQAWHLPTAPDPPTGREFIAMAAREFGVPSKVRILGRPTIRIVGLFNSEVRESYEMLYQNDRPYLFDSSKFVREFGFAGTPYPEGIHIAAESYRSKT
ncbi:MAG: NAD-dependent epimerase/dehydratase family protein [Terracidiphilus sp.]|nr:NAD-dependent epimerase/dehydratase family protein [Terracidiphilus sp.]MDR3796600.1 NAD-dependent epimerase/dehydratase family protein [Terracidiphilus sp.]